MATVTKPIALDESINTTENTPRNIADVLADELSNIADKIQGGGGSGGHTIQNASGANMPQESTMQFKDSHVTDNSQAGKTEVEVIKSVTQADYPSETEDGLYLIPDGDGSVIEPASEDYVEVTADGNKTYAELLNTIFAMADTSKINQDSCFVVAGVNTFIAYPCYFGGSSEFRFTYSRISQTQSVFMTYKLSSSSGHYQDNNGTRTDESTSKPSNGTKLTLYYGNDKAVVDLQTTANRCWLSNGDTVESALTYSTSEHVVGKWIDGKPLYEKTIDCGALPLSTGKTVSHGITGISAVVKFEMVAYGNGQAISIPYFDGTNRCIAYMATGNTGQISIFTNTDAFSSYTKSYAIIRYTKSS